VLDIRTGLAGSVLQDPILLEVAATPGRVVLNTSLGAPCAVNAGGCTVAEAGASAPQWIERVRGRGLEDDFLQAAAAGDLRSAQRLRPSRSRRRLTRRARRRSKRGRQRRATSVGSCRAGSAYCPPDGFGRQSRAGYQENASEPRLFRRCRYGFGCRPRAGQGYEHEFDE
jgi:hypothetical protein